MKLRTLHLFAGIGGGLLADLIMGHEPVVAIEQDAYSCEVLRCRAAEGWFPNIKVIQDDVRKIDPDQFEGSVDTIAAGFPCQPFSINGSRRGFADERGQLFYEVIRFARSIRPQYILLENVPAILVSGFQHILTALAEIGYDAQWTCLSASAVGAPHQRERWWAVAYPHGESGQADECGKEPGQKRQHHRIPLQEGTPWTAERQPHPVVDGISERLAYDGKAVKAYGNAQVPLQAAIAFAMLGYPVNLQI